MKRIGITQRVEVIEAYGERRDCLDQRWQEVASALNCMLLPLPNLPGDHIDVLVTSFGTGRVFTQRR